MKQPISQCGQRFEYDVLVCGSGIAGLSFILDLLEIRPQTRIALLTKKELAESNSRYAQGGIAAVSLPEDSVQDHIRDTIAAGDGLCNEKAAEALISPGPQQIHKLVERGVQFDSKDGKTFELAMEGGHSYRRIHHAGDHTGEDIIQALVQQVKSKQQVDCFENHTIINLITQTEKHSPGSPRETVGAYILDERKEMIHTFLAKATVIATGGAGKIYRFTSNPEVATGDGIAMAYRAGARVGNLEFYQFHPTLLYHTKINNFLLSEALRGEGAYLKLPDNEERFMKRYAPKEMELATRDIVARAIFTEIERSSHNFVYLDIRHRGKEFLQKHFPHIFETLNDLGLDLGRDLIPVVPAAHYLCGGILTNTNGQTDLKRLFAIGEAAFTGLHGANRLASNSLLEGVALAFNAAQKTVPTIDQPVKIIREIRDWDSKSVSDSRRATQITAQWRSLRGEMNSYAGIIRTEAGLRDLLKIISCRREIIEDYYWTHTITRDLLELRNIALLSELIARCALNRRESRGGHYREDFPNRLPEGEESILRFNENFPFSDQPNERPSQ